jgi:hypothetical protein
MMNSTSNPDGAMADVAGSKSYAIKILLATLLLLAGICAWRQGSLRLPVLGKSVNENPGPHVVTPANSDSIMIQTPSKHLTCAVLSPDGALVAFTTSTGSSISVADATTGRQIKSLQTNAMTNPLLFSDDGQLLVSVCPRVWKEANPSAMGSMAVPSGGAITVWSVPSFEAKHKLELVQMVGRISADNKAVMFSDSLNNINILHIDDESNLFGSTSTLFQSPFGALRAERSAAVAFSIHSRRVGYLVKESQPGRPSTLPPKFIVLGDMANADTRLIEPKSLNQVSPSSIALSPSGDHLALGDKEGLIRIYKFDSLQLLRELIHKEGELQPITFLRFSPEGDWIVAGKDDGSLRVWKTGDGQLLRSIEGNGTIVRDVAFIPGSIRVLYGGQIVLPKLSSDPDMRPDPTDVPRFAELKIQDLEIPLTASSN